MEPQLLSFILGMGPSVLNLKRLEVNLCSNIDVKSADRATASHSLLAPARQQLQVARDIRRRLLVTFGTHCTSLSCLKVSEG